MAFTCTDIGSLKFGLHSNTTRAKEKLKKTRYTYLQKSTYHDSANCTSAVFKHHDIHNPDKNWLPRLEHGSAEMETKRRTMMDGQPTYLGSLVLEAAAGPQGFTYKQMGFGAL